MTRQSSQRGLTDGRTRMMTKAGYVPVRRGAGSPTTADATRKADFRFFENPPRTRWWPEWLKFRCLFHENCE